MRVTDPAVSNANEVSIAINPTDPRNLIVVSRARSSANGGRSTSFDYVSEDEGITWRTRRVVNPVRRTQGDDSVAFSADGVAHHAFIAFRGLRDVRPEAPANGIFVTSSSDRGASWTDCGSTGPQNGCCCGPATPSRSSASCLRLRREPRRTGSVGRPKQ